LAFRHSVPLGAGPCGGQLGELPVQNDAARQPEAAAHCVLVPAYDGTQLVPLQL
jgi:hypothetical protein